MSHTIYYDHILEQLFLLEQIAHGSFETVTFLGNQLGTEKMGMSFSPAEIAVYGYRGLKEDSYWDYLHKFVSNYLIECATKTRIIQDISDFSIDDSNYCPDEESYSKFSTLAKIIEGNFNLSIRECCNKIIHAQEVELIRMTDNCTGLEYWSGLCVLSGSKANKSWKLELDVRLWILAMRCYYELIKEL